MTTLTCDGLNAVSELRDVYYTFSYTLKKFEICDFKIRRAMIWKHSSSQELVSMNTLKTLLV